MVLVLVIDFSRAGANREGRISGSLGSLLFGGAIRLLQPTLKAVTSFLVPGNFAKEKEEGLARRTRRHGGLSGIHRQQNKARYPSTLREHRGLRARYSSFSSRSFCRSRGFQQIRRRLAILFLDLLYAAAAFSPKRASDSFAMNSLDRTRDTISEIFCSKQRRKKEGLARRTRRHGGLHRQQNKAQYPSTLREHRGLRARYSSFSPKSFAGPEVSSKLGGVWPSCSWACFTRPQRSVLRGPPALLP
jgi:hypothetical protein